MQFSFSTLSKITRPLPMLVVPLFSDQKLPKEYQSMSTATDGALQKMIDTGDFEAKSNTTHLIYPHSSDCGYERVLLLGLGKKKEFTLDRLRRAVGTGIIAAQRKKVSSVGFVFPGAVLSKWSNAEFGEYTARGVHTAAYSFDTYKTSKESKTTMIAQVTLCDVPGNKRAGVQKGLAVGSHIGESITLVRELGNMPPHEMTPTYLAKRAQKLANEFGRLNCTVLDRAQMKKEKMGALLGVSWGSAEPPKFIILEYKNAPKSKGTTVLVGKGITFDSGGISIKPSAQMDEMKYDMLGGGTVIGTVRAIAALKLKVNVIGLIPATENLSGQAAYRPGDILRAANGKTIEVLNTDAEGRLILADALSYAGRYKPKYCIDLATLTGACVVALGHERAAVFSEEKKLLKVLQGASAKTGDAIWHMPLGPEFSALIKSKIADVKNIGGRYGGANTAAAFLQEFTDYPWAHLDIAGTGWNMKPKPWIRAGATGHGVHLLVEALRQL